MKGYVVELRPSMHLCPDGECRARGLEIVDIEEALFRTRVATEVRTQNRRAPTGEIRLRPGVRIRLSILRCAALADLEIRSALSA